MNKAQLIDAIAAEANLTKADAKRALDAFISTTNNALKNGNIAGTGRKLAGMIQAHIISQATTEADTMLSDGALSLEELGRVFE